MPFTVSESCEHCLRPKEDTCFYRAVHSTPFLNFIALAIVGNSALIAVVTQWDMNKIGAAEHPQIFPILDAVFCCIFTIELLFKVMTERLGIITSLEWNWNVFDAVLVGSALFDQISLLAVSKEDEASGSVNFMFLRMLRMVRLVRVVRVIRVLRAFSGLRIMLTEILGGLKSLLWMFLLLVFIIFIFGMAVMQGAAQYINDNHYNPTAHNDQVSKELKYWFGTIPQTLSTLFFTISGVESWNNTERILREISAMYSIMFILFTFFVVFGVLNVVNGVFVESTSECAKKDKEEIIKAELEMKDTFIEELKVIFEEADADGSGTITWEEFEERFKSPEVLAYFNSLDLDGNEAEQLFRLMDDDGTGAISIDEFLNGIIRLKGGARKMDHLILMDRIDKIYAEVHKMYKAVFSDKRAMKAAKLGSSSNGI